MPDSQVLPDAAPTTKTSPGPFTYEADSAERRSYRVRDADGRSIALVMPAMLSSHARGHGVMAETTEAHRNEAESNARLFSASSAMAEALQAWDDLEEQVADCEEHEPEDAPETCPDCFPFADRARLMMRAALALSRGEDGARERFEIARQRTASRGDGPSSDGWEADSDIFPLTGLHWWDGVYVPWTDPSGTAKAGFIGDVDGREHKFLCVFRDADEARRFLAENELAAEQIASGVPHGVAIWSLQKAALQSPHLLLDWDLAIEVPQEMLTFLQLAEIVPNPGDAPEVPHA